MKLTAQKLKKARTKRGWSQSDLNAATVHLFPPRGVNVFTISAIERGVSKKPRTVTLEMLAAALGLMDPRDVGRLEGVEAGK